MALSDEWTDWHLTPRGWKEGSTQIDFGNRTDRPRPSDAVVTVRYREEIPAMFAKPERWCEETWRGQQAGRIESLLAQFGTCPESL